MSTGKADSGCHPDESGRVQRLEESVGFTEHTVEQLGQQLTELIKRTEHIARRLELIERRLEVLSSGDGPDTDSMEA